MKRSEMVTYISKLIAQITNQAAITHEGDALNLLYSLECKGMLPPLYLKKYKPLPSKTAAVEVHEWEPENE